jgi:hypothetical protein
MLIPVFAAELNEIYCDSKAAANAKHPTHPPAGLDWLMVAKRGSKTGLEPDPMGPVLDSLVRALDIATKDLSAEAAEESERRAKTLAALSKVAELLSGLLRERRAEAQEQMSEGSDEDAAAQARDAAVWRDFTGRIARLRTAQVAAADGEAARSAAAGEAPP